MLTYSRDFAIQKLKAVRNMLVEELKQTTYEEDDCPMHQELVIGIRGGIGYAIEEINHQIDHIHNEK